jgi:hypothetical protein
MTFPLTITHAEATSRISAEPGLDIVTCARRFAAGRFIEVGGFRYTPTSDARMLVERVPGWGSPQVAKGTDLESSSTSWLQSGPPIEDVVEHLAAVRDAIRALRVAEARAVGYGRELLGVDDHSDDPEILTAGHGQEDDF